VTIAKVLLKMGWGTTPLPSQKNEKQMALLVWAFSLHAWKFSSPICHPFKNLICEILLKNEKKHKLQNWNWNVFWRFQLLVKNDHPKKKFKNQQILTFGFP
jgi:hypothetical protein